MIYSFSYLVAMHRYLFIMKPEFRGMEERLQFYEDDRTKKAAAGSLMGIGGGAIVFNNTFTSFLADIGDIQLIGAALAIGIVFAVAVASVT